MILQFLTSLFFLPMLIPLGCLDIYTISIYYSHFTEPQNEQIFDDRNHLSISIICLPKSEESAFF